MRRPLPVIACGLSFGILLAANCGFWAVLVSALLGLLSFSRRRWRVWLPITCAICLGTVWLLVRSPVWPGGFGSATSQFVVQQVESAGRMVSLTVRLSSLHGQAIPFWNPVRAHLYVEGGGFAVGDVLSGEIDWQEPDRPINPGEFNYAAYERRQGVLATCFLQSSGALQRLTDAQSSSLPLRETLLVRAHLIPGAAGELLATLVLGDPAGDWALAWRQAGLAHVLAVSGLHVGLLLAMLLGLLTRLKVPPRWRHLIAAGLLVGYGLLVGPRASVWRAIIMALIGILALATGRLRDWPSSLAAAASLLLVANPWLLFDAGWQLSFAATWGVLALSPLIASHLPLLPYRLDRLLGTSLAAQTATLPIVLFHFYLVTPFALISNLLVVPLLPAILALGLLYLLLFPFTSMLAPLVGWVYNALLALVNWLASWPAVSISPGQPPFWLVALAAVLLVLIWLNRRQKITVRLAVGWLIVALLSLSWQPLSRFICNRYELRVLSVGQGAASVLHLPGGKALLFDVGGGGAGVGRNIIVPYLRQRGTLNVGAVYLSHLDTDHVLGLADVLAAFPVQSIFVSGLAREQEGYADLCNLAAQFGVPLYTLDAGDELQDQALRVTVLHPRVGSPAVSANEDSLVLELSWPNMRVLLPGDIGSATEAELLPELLLPVDVLLVAHHGSAYSSSEQFLTTLAPTASVISTGPNRYGHPAPATVERLQRYSQEVLRTDQAGAVLIWTNLKAHGISSFLAPWQSPAVPGQQRKE